MRYKFFICDVFTRQAFGGNQLAVLPEADGLDATQMQNIAREFNFAESTFVFGADDALTRQVRIFTPVTEIPFAGHPNIGTAFALARDGGFGTVGNGVSVTFLEQAGRVEVSIRPVDEGRYWCELMAPQTLSLGKEVAPELLARAMSLEVADIKTECHAPVEAGVGLPFLFVELASLEALQRARVDMAALDTILDSGVVADIHLYVHSGDEFDIRARMFAPLDGIPEDPATGSANCALAALLTHLGHDGSSRGGSWRIAQGVEMGRPSLLEARTRREDGVIKAWIGGDSVFVAEGFLEIE
jgi:trans-2,3-dihydro-3-hydroxyanthranilate isomerase